MRLFVAAGLCAVLSASASASFIPGRIYISAAHHMPSGPPRIYEFDPATGQGGVFVQMSSGSPSNLLTSVSFSPDYSRLRAVNFLGSSLLDFAGDGSYSTAWGPGAGLILPSRGTYSPAGDYWVTQDGNFQPAILRFPSGLGPPEVFAQFPDEPLLTQSGEAIAIDRTGVVYCSKDVAVGTDLLRFEPDGRAEVLTTLPGDLASIAIRNVDDILAWTTQGLFRIDPADPDNHVLITKGLLPASDGSLILLPEENALYAVGVFLIQRVDLGTGVVTDIGNNPAVSPYFTISATQYVPEPESLLLFVLGFGVWTYRSRSHGGASLVDASSENCCACACTDTCPPSSAGLPGSPGTRSGDRGHMDRADSDQTRWFHAVDTCCSQCRAQERKSAVRLSRNPYL